MKKLMMILVIIGIAVMFSASKTSEFNNSSKENYYASNVMYFQMVNMESLMMSVPICRLHGVYCRNEEGGQNGGPCTYSAWWWKCTESDPYNNPTYCPMPGCGFVLTHRAQRCFLQGGCW